MDNGLCKTLSIFKWKKDDQGKMTGQIGKNQKKLKGIESDEWRDDRMELRAR